VKFLIDMPLSPTLARWLNSQGHDAVHAADVIARRSDPLAGLSEADIPQSILVVGRDRVRRRRLPIA
jgi:predicted nuclease of predicted toxin-antitoxin system